MLLRPRNQTVHKDAEDSARGVGTPVKQKLLDGISLRIEHSGLAHSESIRAPYKLYKKAYACADGSEVSPDTAPGDHHHAGQEPSG